MEGRQLCLELPGLNTSFIRGCTESTGARLEFRNDLLDHLLVPFKLLVVTNAHL